MTIETAYRLLSAMEDEALDKWARNLGNDEEQSELFGVYSGLSRACTALKAEGVMLEQRLKLYGIEEAESSAWKHSEAEHVKYRLDIDYVDHLDHFCCETSRPIYALEEGIEKYLKAIKDHCIDNESKPPKVHLWEYRYNDNGELDPLTICKNY